VINTGKGKHKSRQSMLPLLRAARGQIKTETGPAEGGVVARTNTAAMGFDNGLTDGQAHAHAGIFGRKEAIEKKREMFRIDTRARRERCGNV
jgi:tRNA(Arg) A34 adenosine deaminase TadA